MRAALRTPLTTIKQMEAAARRKSLRSAQHSGRGGSSGGLKAKRRLSGVLSPAGDAEPAASSRKQVRQ